MSDRCRVLLLRCVHRQSHEARLFVSVAPNDAVLEAGLVIDTQRDERPAAEYRLDSGKAVRLFPPESQAAVRLCEHTVHTAKFKSSS